MNRNRSYSESKTDYMLLPCDDEKKSDHLIDIHTDTNANLIMEKKLNLCIAILKSQIKKRKCIPASFYFINGSAILTSAAHQIISACFYNSAINNLYSSIATGTTFTCFKRWDIQWFFLSECRYDRDIIAPSFSCKNLISTLLKWQEVTQQDPTCRKAIDNILSGPGMWNGYLPVAITLGITVPVVLSCIFFSSIYLDKLPAEKKATIHQYAELYNIKISNSMDIAEVLERFETRLDQLKQDENLRSSRKAFLMSSLEKNKKSPVHLLFKSAMSEPQLCRLIFFMAGIDKGLPQETKRVARKYFLDAAHSKNKGSTLHSFFTCLDKTGHKREVVENIFEFAGIKY